MAVPQSQMHLEDPKCFPKCPEIQDYHAEFIRALGGICISEEQRQAAIEWCTSIEGLTYEQAGTRTIYGRLQEENLNGSSEILPT